MKYPPGTTPLLNALRFAFTAAAITGCNLTPGSAQPTTLALGGDRVPASAALVRHAFGPADSHAVLVDSSAYEVVIMGLAFERGRYALTGGGAPVPFSAFATVKGPRPRVYRVKSGTLDLRGGAGGSLQGTFSFETEPIASHCPPCRAEGPSVSGIFQATPGGAAAPARASPLLLPAV